MGLHRLADAHQLVHQLLVDVKPARGVHDQHVAALRARALERPRGDLGGIWLGPPRVHRRSCPLADGHELFDGGRALGVAGRERDALLVLREVHGELRARRRLARPLKPRHQDHRGAGRGEGDIAARRAHQRGKLVVDNLHDLLARVEALEHSRAEAPLANRLRERLHDLEVDVRLEQGEADLAHRRRDV